MFPTRVVLLITVFVAEILRVRCESFCEHPRRCSIITGPDDPPAPRDFTFLVSNGNCENSGTFDFNCEIKDGAWVYSYSISSRDDTQALHTIGIDYGNTLVIILSEVSEISGVLKQIADLIGIKSGGGSGNVTNKVRDLRVLLVVPVPEYQLKALLLNQTHLESRVLSQLDSTTLSQFSIESTVLLAFFEVGQSSRDTCARNDVCRKHDDEDFPLLLHVWELYSIQNQSFLSHVFTSTNGTGLASLFESSSQLARRQDLSGVVVTAGVFTYGDDGKSEFQASKFETHLHKLEDGTSALHKGLSASVFWDFETALNFTGKIHALEYSSSSFEVEFAKLKYSFDITISHFGLVPQRLSIAEYLQPMTYFDGIVVYFLQPPSHTFRNIYTTPFTKELWGMMLATWMVISLCFHIVHWIRRLLYYSSGDNSELGFDEQVKRDVLSWALAATCQQGWYMSPGSTPARFVFLTGLMFSFLCYSAYTAEIVSQLWENVVPFTTLEQLFSNSEKIYMTPNSDVATLIVEGMIKSNPELLGKVRLENRAVSFQDIFRSKGRSSILDWPDYFTAAGREAFGTRQSTGNDDKYPTNPDVRLCDTISSLPYKYLPVKATMFVRKGSPLKALLNYRILVGYERGFLRRYWTHYKRNTGLRCFYSVKHVYALSIYDTFIVFLVLLSGFGLSLVFLLLEKLTSRKLTPATLSYFMS